MKQIRKITEPFIRIAFPAVCMSCGESTGSGEKTLCDRCRYGRFEPAENPGDIILPGHVHHLHSLWVFDKGGSLQNLLHQLKYNYMRGTGVELGILLGQNFLKQSVEPLQKLEFFKNPVLIPVPLHKSKKRKRGFNQSAAIAEGVSRATGWPVEAGSVVRVKRTSTQTGLNASQRSNNLKGAFVVNRSNLKQSATPLIVDDVFTTGATTFELSATLERSGFAPAVIMTVARA